MRRFWQTLRAALDAPRMALMALGMGIATFALFNIHRNAAICEGGVLGMVLLVNHHLGLAPWLVSALLDAGCYALGWRLLGGRFLVRSLFASACGAAWLRLWEAFGPLLEPLRAHPAAAALLGGLGVGVGVGLVVRQGGSSGGDDALALSIAHKTGWRLARAYLMTDVTVLALSASYLPLARLGWSLLTVCLSSLLIDRIGRARCAGA